MFITECPSLGHEIVVVDADVDTRTPTPHGTAVEFTCRCGGWGIYLCGSASISGRLVLHSVGPIAA